MITASDGEYLSLLQNPQLKEVCNAYLKQFIPAVFAKKDKENAKKLGVSAGGNIMIHGLPNYAPCLGSLHRLKDWTQGCIAVNNQEIEEIYAAVKDGTVIEILP